MLIYASQEIEDFMRQPQNLPEFAIQAQDFIRGIHAKYAPSNIYDPKSFDHLKELEVRKLFAERSRIEAQRKAFQTDKAIRWNDISI